MKDRVDVTNWKLQSYSLANVCKFFKLEDKQDDFDYYLLSTDELINDNWDDIVKYTQQDILITTQLWHKIEEFFKPFADTNLISQYDIDKYKHITLRTSAYAYRVVCRKAKLREIYKDTTQHAHYSGGYVATPQVELVKGNIYCVDFASLYPHIFMQANLFQHDCKCCTTEEKYRGKDLFNINGAYCSKEQGPIEKTIQWLYNTRKTLKANNDPRQYAYKITLNIIYGICGNEKFKSVYNINTASDCTAMAQTSVKLAQTMFNNAGYNVIYMDTDSCYIEDKYNDEAKMLKVKDDIINKLKDNFNFPVETFDMDIDYRIKTMYFPGLKKKNYLFVTSDNNVVLKGFPLIKDNASKASMVVYKKYIEPLIQESGEVQFDNSFVIEKLNEELSDNLSLAMVTYKVKDEKEYKLASQLQAQISKKYGVGVHNLIPNNRFGVGKSKKYCTVEEFEKEGLTINNIILEKTYNELKMFAKKPDNFKQGNSNERQVKLI